MKKKIPYLIITLISILIFLFVFIDKGIYPFGNHTLIYGDMFDQITAFYYHFYDAFKGSDSFLIDFSTSGGINFFGIMTYYILSPFTLLLLLFQRNDIHLAVSIIIALKCITSCITMLYALRYIFKEKTNNFLSIIVALCYGFSGYFLNLYQITPWMDAVYLFPLVVVGLRKALDLERPYMYIICLTLSFITSFYVTVISLFFIFFLSFIYIRVYVDKSKQKKSVLSLGINTVISVLLSLFVIIPSYLQISASSRLTLNLSKIFNSKLGPITDKIAFFIPGTFLFAGIVLLILNYKKNKKFSKFIFPSLIITGIPFIIEPVNKILHFGSYAMFPCRFGYIMFFLLAVGCCYAFTYNEFKSFSYNVWLRRVIGIIVTILCSVSLTFILNIKYDKIQEQIYTLTISGNKTVILILFGSMILTFVTYILISFMLNKKDKFYYPLVFTVFIVATVNYSLLYLGNDHYQHVLTSTYDTLNEFRDIHKKDDYYRVKNNTVSLITNNGMVSDFNNLDHFTSVVDGNNLRTLKILGYKSYWTKNFSKGGTLFTDILLGNKYYLTKAKFDNDMYKLLRESHGFKLYEFNKDISYGYFTSNTDIIDERASLELQNNIYKSITNSEDNLFEIYDYEDFEYKNIDILKKYKVYYSINDNNVSNYIEKEIKVDKKSIIYLDVLNSLHHSYDTKTYHSFNIYVNNKLYVSDYPNKDSNGILEIGTYDKGDVVNIKIELLKNTKFTTLEIGVMDYNKLMEFIDEEKIDSKIKFRDNKIIINVNSDRKGIFFIPVNYIDGYSVKVNNQNSEVIKTFDNYLGVSVDKGENEIVYSYIPKGLIPCSIISIVTLLGTFILFKFKLYDKILSCNWLLNVVFKIYLILYCLMMFVIYFIPIICFVVSYFTYI